MSGTKVFKVLFAMAAICILISAAAAGETTSRRALRAMEKIKINVVPVGISGAVIDTAKARILQSDAVKTELAGTKFYLISLEPIENGTPIPTAYRAVLYDYSNDRTLVAEGDFAGKQNIKLHPEAFQPLVSQAEFDTAVAILASDTNFASLINTGSIKPFKPMPPVTVLDGTIERLVNVGIDSTGGGRNEVVSVSIKRGEVIRYPANAPPTSAASPDTCGVPDAGQATSFQGTAGQYQMTVTQGPTTLWEMLILRPAASSGTNSSGIEIQNVKYKGKSVLKRGHVPVLDVQYLGGQCGPYRDWQYEEDMFQTPATGNTDPAPGVRVLADGQVATTALESGNDTGNFRGVAIYKQDVGNGTETVLVTEMQAGWYRYIMEWRFAPNGVIRPRFGFGATDDSCVCFTHHHHVYWRFDFDVVNSNNKVFQIERGRKFQTPITTETTLNKNLPTNRGILVQNSTGDEAYEVMPNLTDGAVDAFGAHDFWLLRYKNVVGGNPIQNEIDDGRECCSSNASINIDSWVNGESLVDQDIVVWYGAHFLHDDGGNGRLNASRSPEVLTGSHVVGPDLRPVRW